MRGVDPNRQCGDEGGDGVETGVGVTRNVLLRRLEAVVYEETGNVHDPVVTKSRLNLDVSNDILI